MKRGNFTNLKHQRGHAAILFALIIPGMWGFFTLAIDGSRALQTKARLGDATEVAALALAAQNSDIDQENNALAKSYIAAYIKDVENINITKILRTECHVTEIVDCGGVNRYAQYQISTSIRQAPWLPVSGDLVGFEESYDVTHNSTARKYQGDSIDIGFVLDYSGSMDSKWKLSDGKNSKNKKYIEMRNIINDVLDELEAYKKYRELENKVSVVSFSEFSKLDDNSIKCDSGDTKLKYIDYLYYDKVTGRNKSSVNAEETVSNWKNDRLDEKALICNEKLGNSQNRPYKDMDIKFGNVKFTEEFQKVRDQLAASKPGGWTASYQGIIRSAQYFNQLPKRNPRQLMVIITDGEDTNGDNGPLKKNGDVPTQELINNHLCSSISSHLSSYKTDNNRPVHFQFALIGFGYNVSQNPLTSCVGIDNVYQAENPEQLLNIILDLISEEIGHLS